MKEATPALLERGRVLFNEGRYFEAHEVWEEAWLEEVEEIRTLLQGLIQIAAALLKASRGERPSGCAQLVAAGRTKLAPLPGTLAGLDLIAFRRAIERFDAAAEPWFKGGAAGPPAPDVFPRLGRAGAPE